MNWLDFQLWYFIGVFTMALLAQHLVSPEPFNKKRFFGELIFSVIGAMAFYAAGLLQGMSTMQMIFFGSMSALGGVRTLEWLIRILSVVRKLPNIAE